MENYLIKDLMVPISEYATVHIGTSLIDAVQALKKGQQSSTTKDSQHRAVLVLDGNGDVVGKISQVRALNAIEPEFDYNFEIDKMKKFNFSDEYIAQLRDLYRSHGQVMSEKSLQEAAKKKVEDFMQTPSVGEYVSEDSSLDTAIHRLVAGSHLSLLVTRDEKIVGILTSSDVFSVVFDEMKTLAQ